MNNPDRHHRNQSLVRHGLTAEQLAAVLEAAMLVHAAPMSLERMASLFDESQKPLNSELRAALELLDQQLQGRGIELVKVASGYRLQVRQHTMPWVSRLWQERPPRYTRALLETLVLIAYRQPVTRGDIEDVRGVVVSSGIIKTLLEREWIKVVGHRDVPGRPALFATTAEFLDYFGLSSLDQLPSLMAIRELDEDNRKQALGENADAKRRPDEDYTFTRDEDVARRGADVLDATADDLAEADALVARVEQNLLARNEHDSGSNNKITKGSNTEGVPARKQLDDLIDRLQQPAQRDASQTPADSAASEDDAEDARKQDKPS
ncbi:SMC-Scp complex subunit ScpB [Oceanobacter sp. 3_MG-2023]|jgi:segregation and condensation protein B|uniref:SMC-Scp complex subunit ScpB n=1 Tax=Oceanobacter sp. 3_MG-2023 TaxID=3062622 RepID=UPI002734CC73|nr:SMC-Scp complex subunit ScpB [Oceanobacter sp. 3_MG-2023]MDP2507009.1 SMC-Scp complex subunit ScpB [Oceanobacter sp. 3_MG-2023]